MKSRQILLINSKFLKKQQFRMHIDNPCSYDLSMEYLNCNWILKKSDRKILRLKGLWEHFCLKNFKEFFFQSKDCCYLICCRNDCSQQPLVNLLENWEASNRWILWLIKIFYFYYRLTDGQLAHARQRM